MKKLYIGLPLEMEYQSLGLFLLQIFSLLFFAVVGTTLDYYFLILPITIIPIPILIYLRIKSRKSLVIISDTSILLPSNINIEWKDIEKTYITYVFEKDSRNEEDGLTGYPLFLLKFKDDYKLNIQDVFQTRFKTNIPYIVNREYFKKYFGNDKDFDIAINFQNVDEKSSEQLLEKIPVLPSKKRPLINVRSKEEYNKYILGLMNKDVQKEYILK